MKLKGDLDSIGVAELFKTLADQRATGILSVNSPMGEKTVALSLGEIAIATDNLSERTRLGDLLVARGRLTEAQLAEALKAQKLNPRAKLGDLMVKQGMITQEIIGEAVRFQVEEQILDLYSWKDAQFEFDSDKSVDDVYDPDGSGNPVQRLSISVAPLVAEAAKRQENWKQIQQRIPTPYLCFKITPKGEELVSKSPRNTQTIIKLLKEGRTLETTIKRSCIGRFNVCMAVCKLLDDNWIMPTPAAELRFLASEHRFKKRFLDALYIYRRLQDSASTDADKTELERSIQDTIDAIHAANAAGETAEGTEIISYKEAAAKFKRRQKARRLAMAIFGVTAFIVAAILLFQQFAPKPSLPDDYKRAIDQASLKLDQKDYDGAIKIWSDFYKKVPPDSDLGKWSREREAAAIGKQKTFLKEVFKQATDLEKGKKWTEAKAALRDYIEKYPTSDDTDAANEHIKNIEEIEAKEIAQGINKKQEDDTAAAEKLVDSKQYTNARQALEKVSRTLPEGSDFLKRIRDKQKFLQDLEENATNKKTTADTEVRDNQAEKAIQDYDDASKDWPDLPVAEEARKASATLKIRFEMLKKEILRAKDVRGSGGDQAALDVYTQIKRDFPEFEKTREIDKEMGSINTNVASLDQRLLEAQKFMKAGDKNKAREIFKELMTRDFTFCAMHELKVPVLIESFPGGASVKLDGRAVGVTPVEIELPVDKPFTLHFERKGYEAFDKSMKGLNVKSGDADKIVAQLKRTYLAKILFESLDLKGANHKSGIFAPPIVIDGTLCVLHGNSLTLLDPSGSGSARKLESLFAWDERSMDTRPESSGGDKKELVDANRSWWFPRGAPVLFNHTEPEAERKNKKLLIASRTRDLLEVDLATLQVKKIITLPADPVGLPCVDRSSMRLGHPFVAMGCSDGKVYVYDLDKPEKPIWAPVSIDPTLTADRKVQLETGFLATGVAPRNAHQFLALSSTGILQCFTNIDGKLQWSYKLDCNGELQEGNVLPATENENVAAFVHRDGKVTVLDLSGAKPSVLWTRPVHVENEKAKYAVVASTGVFVVTVEGQVLHYSREGTGNQEPMLLHKRSMSEEPSDIPILVGKSAVFVICKENPASHEHAIFALSAKDVNNQLWFYRTEHKPSTISLHDNLLYIGCEDGTLLILSAD